MKINLNLKQNVLFIWLITIIIFLAPNPNIYSKKEPKKTSTSTQKISPSKSNRESFSKMGEFPEDLSPADFLSQLTETEDGKKMFKEVCGLIGDLGMDQGDPKAFLNEMMSEVEAIKKDPSKKDEFNSTYKDMHESGFFNGLPGGDPEEEVEFDKREEAHDDWEEFLADSSEHQDSTTQDSSKNYVEKSTDEETKLITTSKTKHPFEKKIAKNWIEILTEPRLPITKTEKKIFRKDLVTFGIGIKTLSPHILSNTKFSPLNKNKLIEFERISINFATSLYTFYRPFYLKILLNTENNELRKALIETISEIEQTSQKIINFNSSFLNDDENYDWLENKKIRSTLKNSSKESVLITSVAKTFPKIEENKKKIDNLLKHPKTVEEIKKKKKLYKVTEAVFAKKHAKYFETYKEKLNKDYSKDKYNYKDDGFDWDSYSGFDGPSGMFNPEHQIPPSETQSNSDKKTDAEENKGNLSISTDETIRKLFQDKSFKDLLALDSQINSLTESAYKALTQAFVSIDFDKLRSLINLSTKKRSSKESEDSDETDKENSKKSRNPSDEKTTSHDNSSNLTTHLQKIYRPLLYLSMLPQQIPASLSKESNHQIYILPGYKDTLDESQSYFKECYFNVFSAPSIQSYKTLLENFNDEYLHTVENKISTIKSILKIPEVIPAEAVEKNTKDAWLNSRKELTASSTKRFNNELLQISGNNLSFSTQEDAVKMQGLATNLLISILDFPVFNPKSLVEFSKSYDAFTNQLEAEYQKTIAKCLNNDVDADNNLIIPQDSFETHKILASFSKFIEAVGGQSISDSQDNYAETVLLIIDLLKQMIKKDESGQQHLFDIDFAKSSWETIFYNLKSMQHFDILRSSLTPDIRRQFWQKTTYPISAKFPIYLKRWLQGLDESINLDFFNILKECCSKKINPETGQLLPISEECKALLNNVHSDMTIEIHRLKDFPLEINKKIDSSMQLLDSIIAAEKNIPASFSSSNATETRSPESTQEENNKIPNPLLLEIVRQLYKYFAITTNTDSEIIKTKHLLVSNLFSNFPFKNNQEEASFFAEQKELIHSIDNKIFMLTETKDNTDIKIWKNSFILTKLLILNNLGNSLAEDNHKNSRFAQMMFKESDSYNETFIAKPMEESTEHKFNFKAIAENNQASALEMLLSASIIQWPETLNINFEVLEEATLKTATENADTTESQKFLDQQTAALENLTNLKSGDFLKESVDVSQEILSILNLLGTDKPLVKNEPNDDILGQDDQDEDVEVASQNSKSPNLADLDEFEEDLDEEVFSDEDEAANLDKLNDPEEDPDDDDYFDARDENDPETQPAAPPQLVTHKN